MNISNKALLSSVALLLVLTLYYRSEAAIISEGATIKRDTLLLIQSNTEAGFANSYALYIPKGTPLNKAIYLLVEPNNTGTVSDSMQVHLEAACAAAAKSGLANNISRELRIPLLLPIFPRPSSKPLIYTHALDRDVMLEKSNDLHRLDLQLIAMIADAQQRLKGMDIPTHEKVFMNGFSASGTFVNRFTFLHPEKVRAVTTGGLNGILMLPLNEYQEEKLNYPLGINDFKSISGKEFDLKAYQAVSQFIYMGALDDNDAVLYDDAYNDAERKIIYAAIGKKMQPDRWEKCMEIYKTTGINAQSNTYVNIGHWTTGEMNLKVIRFLMNQI